MNRQIPYWTKWAIIILTVLSLVQGCVKDPLPNDFAKPSITTVKSSVSYNTATLTCTISKTNYKECGFYYGMKSDLSDKRAVKASQGNDKKSAEAVLSNLELGETYYYQAYVNGGRMEVTSGVYSFATILPVSNVTLSQTSLTLNVNQSFTLTATVSPSNATDKTVTWTSSNTSVATVTDGIVKAVAAGTAIITARADSKTATCTVTVYVPVSGVSLNQTSVTLTVGESYTLTATVSPSNAADKTITWSSSNTSVATVSKGTVKAVAAGMATITAKAGDKSATCTVNVEEKFEPEAVDLGLSVKWANCNLGAKKPEEYGDYFAWGETEPKNDYSWSTYKLCNGTNDSMKKYNTDSSYGTVDNKTILDMSDDAARANWGGSWRMPTYSEFQELIDNCTWTWTTLDGKNGYWVTSKKNGNSIFLPAAGYRYGSSLGYDGSVGYYWFSSLYTKTPDRAWNLAFTSSNLYLSGSRCYGNTVRPVYGDLISVTRVSLDRTSITLDIGSSSTLVATVYPSNATDKTVIWSSTNTSVATVSDGTVKAVASGTATITAIAGGKTATCSVTVNVPVSSVSLNYTSLTLTQGDSFTLTATVSPSNASNKTVTWSSSNTSVATVSNGTVKALAAGTATITAKAGGKTATCTVVVKKPGVVEELKQYWNWSNSIYHYYDYVTSSYFNGPRVLYKYSKPRTFSYSNQTYYMSMMNGCDMYSAVTMAPSRTDSLTVFNAIKDFFTQVASSNDKMVPYLKYMYSTDGGATYNLQKLRADRIEFNGFLMKSSGGYLKAKNIPLTAIYDNKGLVFVDTAPDPYEYYDAFSNLIDLFLHFIGEGALNPWLYNQEDEQYSFDKL